jgi:NADH dehydrogenase FAD-containing subunit
MQTSSRSFEALQVPADAPIFVVGDSGTIRESPTPKAGVYAVREGPILWKNLARRREGRPLVPYRPQRGFLKLLNTGDGGAIGEFDGLSFQGRWCWALKDFLDRRFGDQYRVERADRPRGG